jgi:hypothetical protein
MFVRTFSALAAFVVCCNAASADPTFGDIAKIDVVGAMRTDIYTVAFNANELTRIRVNGDGDTCLELRVYDQFGNLVRADTLGLGDDREVIVTPRWTGKFRIEVRNIGFVSNRYLFRVD